MTHAPEPNDLSHLSDEEFMALCPLGEHAPGPEPLSPAAQAVLDAFTEDNSLHDWKHNHFNVQALAVALRAAAEQVAPEFQETPWGTTVQAAEPLLHVRRNLLTIAAELEGDGFTGSTH